MAVALLCLGCESRETKEAKKQAEAHRFITTRDALSRVDGQVMTKMVKRDDRYLELHFANGDVIVVNSRTNHGSGSWLEYEARKQP